MDDDEKGKIDEKLGQNIIYKKQRKSFWQKQFVKDGCNLYQEKLRNNVQQHPEQFAVSESLKTD